MNTPTNLLTQWLNEEAQILQPLNAGPGPGVARPEQIAGKTGLEQMQAMLNGEIPHAAIASTLDFLIIGVEDGVATFQGTPGPAAFQPHGHGARRLVRHPARFRPGLRRAHQDARRPGLHHRRTQRQHRQGAHAQGATRARHRHA